MTRLDSPARASYGIRHTKPAARAAAAPPRLRHIQAPMAADVFLSYARSASAGHARALADALGSTGISAFLDEREIPYGEAFPERLRRELLGARVVVVFCEPAYFTRWYCRLEYEAALTPFRRLLERGAPETERVAALDHLVIALSPGGADAELDALPPATRSRNWVRASDTPALARLVRQQQNAQGPTLGERLDAVLGRAQAEGAFTQQAPLPQPLRLAPLPGQPPLPVVVPLGLRGTLRERFVGRADDLWRLHDALAPASTTTGGVTLTSTVRGVGGVGKTQLAAEYLYRYGPRHYTGGLFWLDATRDVDEQHHAMLQALGVSLPDLPALRDEMSRDQIAVLLRQRLSQALRGIPSHTPALLIVDDVPELPGDAVPDPLEKWCPAPDAAACLVTSRRHVHYAGGGALTPLVVDVLAPDDAVAVLSAGSVNRSLLTGRDWLQIAAWVGYLPLALALLNSAIGDLEPRILRRVHDAASRGHSTTRELDAAMDALRSVVPTGALRGVSEAFLLSYDYLPRDAQSAALTLAQFAPEPLPYALMDALGAPFDKGSVPILLRARSFIMSVRSGSAGADVPVYGTMHGVLGDFLRARLEETNQNAERLAMAMSAILAVMTWARCNDPAAWPLMHVCLPHAQRLIAASSADDRAPPLLLVSLAQRVGEYLWARGDGLGARQAKELAVELAMRHLGPGHADTLASISTLASTLRGPGEFQAAREHLAGVIEAQESSLGAEHRDTLRSYHRLACTLWSQGDHDDAHRVAESVVKSQLRLFGADDPQTLTCMGTLASVLWSVGDAMRARTLQEDVLGAYMRLFGARHPVTLRSMHNLASTLGSLGERARALSLQQEVVELRTQILGEAHPATLTSMHNLAGMLWDLGDFAAACRLEERVVEDRARVLGTEHPSTLHAASALELWLAQVDP